MNNLQTLTRQNIWNTIDDYFRHSYSTDVHDDISDSFVNRLADDSIESKHELRDLFRISDGWNEQLQAIVINGTKTHNPNYILVHNFANSILTPAKHDADWRKIDLIDRAISFFSRARTISPTAISTLSMSLRLMPMLRARNAVGFSKPFAIRWASRTILPAVISRNSSRNLPTNFPHAKSISSYSSRLILLTF